MGVSKIVFASYTGLFHLFVDEVKHLCIRDCRERIVLKPNKEKAWITQLSVGVFAWPVFSSQHGEETSWGIATFIKTFCARDSSVLCFANECA